MFSAFFCCSVPLDSGLLAAHVLGVCVCACLYGSLVILSGLMFFLFFSPVRAVLPLSP